MSGPSLTLHFLLKPGKWGIMYLCVRGYRIVLFLWFWYLILELFGQCAIFWFFILCLLLRLIDQLKCNAFEKYNSISTLSCKKPNCIGLIGVQWMFHNQHNQLKYACATCLSNVIKNRTKYSGILGKINKWKVP